MPFTLSCSIHIIKPNRELKHAVAAQLSPNRSNILSDEGIGFRFLVDEPIESVEHDQFRYISYAEALIYAVILSSLFTTCLMDRIDSP